MLAFILPQINLEGDGPSHYLIATQPAGEFSSVVWTVESQYNLSMLRPETIGRIIALTLTLANCHAFSQESSEPGSKPMVIPKKPIMFDLSSVDRSIDPCMDFYQYACGNWIRNNPIPQDQSRWRRGSELQDQNDYLLYADLKTAAASPKTPVQKKYGDFFAACMNIGLADRLGAQPLEPLLRLIDQWNDKANLGGLLGEMSGHYGQSMFFSSGRTWMREMQPSRSR